MVSYNYRRYYKADLDMLKFVGIWIENDTNLYKSWYSVLININYLVISLGLMMDWVFNTRSFVDFGITYIKPICFMAPIKSFLLMNNLSELRSVLADLEDLLFQPENNFELQLVKEVLDNFQKNKRVMIAIVGTGIVGSGLYPLFDQTRLVPFPAWYPFNITKPLNFIFVYSHQFICVLIIGGLNMYCDIVISGMATFIGLQCQILCLRLGNISKMAHNERQKMLVKCVKHHVLILRFLGNVKHVFGTIYFWQICLCTMTLCMGLFLLSLSEPNSVEFFYLILYQVAISFLLLVPCWFATQMTEQSEQIAVAAYFCNWIDSDNEFKKDISFFILRSQDPLKLYAANFFEISVVTFVKIIRSSLSYYAALSNLNSEEE
ncbi:hypothetical protein GWI33_018869 [Rhynchophorus ferrugineus]|uniref:Odorant receptor n=1 Tax=Rhynchophorus ferrugineus TaxID=354439 RepID=A0A834HVH4_RHYFE|nr:hypothetical protein GWI33_018869 [Rhynchophorus ferrugineus]